MMSPRLKVITTSTSMYSSHTVPPVSSERAALRASCGQEDGRAEQVAGDGQGECGKRAAAAGNSQWQQAGGPGMMLGCSAMA